MTRTTITALVALLLTVHGPGRVAYAKPPAADAAAVDAEALYKDRRFLEAAHAFEALATRDLKYLYHAGLAYEAAGHDGQAIAHWRLVSAAPEVEPGLRERARVRAQRAEARTTRLFVTVTPAAAAPGAMVALVYQGEGDRRRRLEKLESFAEGVYLESGTWKLEVRSATRGYLPDTNQVTLGVRDAQKTVEIALVPIKARVFLTITPPAAADSRPLLTLRDDAGIEITMNLEGSKSSSPLQLHPGWWSYSIQAPGFEQTKGRFHVRGGENTKLSISLTPRPTATNTRPLAIGAGVSSVVLATGGALGLFFSENKLRTFKDAKTININKPLTWALDGLLGGSIAVGASVGFLVTAGTAAIKRNQQRRRAWIAEATLGSLLSASGGIWAGHYFFAIWRSDFLNAHTTLGSGDLANYRRNFYPSMLMIGTGTALLVGAVAGLALDRRPPRKHGHHARARLRTFLPLTVDF